MRCTSSQLATTVSEPAGLPFTKAVNQENISTNHSLSGSAVFAATRSARVRARSKKFFSALNLM